MLDPPLAERYSPICMATCRSVRLKHSLNILLSKNISEIPCRVSSDLHEWRNDLETVSTRYSAKLQDE